jgi:signal transduction histidine kinase
MDSAAPRLRGIAWAAVLVLVIAALVTLQRDAPPLQLTRIPSAIAWVPHDLLAGGSSDSAASERLLSAIRAQPNYAISDYVESGVLRALPHFESGKETSRLRVEAFTLDLSQALNLSGGQAPLYRRLAPQFAVLLTQAINGGDIFLNGVWIHGLPKSDRSTRRVWYQPLLVPLPSQLLNLSGGENMLTFVQSTYEPYSLIPNVYVGDYANVSQVAALINFVSHTLASFSILFCLVMGVFMVAARMAASRSATFFYAGCTALIWAVLFTAALWPAMPVDWLTPWRLLLYGLEGIFIVLTSLCVLHLAKVQIRLFWKLVLALYICTAPLMYYLEGASIQQDLDAYWTLLGVGLYAYSVLRLLIHGRRSKEGVAYAMAIVSIICILLALHDHVVRTGWINVNVWHGETWSWHWLLTEPLYLFHFAVPLQLLVVGKVLLDDYHVKSRQVAAANKDLRAALRAREGELQRIYEAKRLLIQQFVQSKEQKRIYQDIHDGIGSRLVSLLFMLKSGKARPDSCVQSLESCIRDLRNVISAHSDVNSDLQSSIFELCLNLEEQLSDSDIVLTYDIADGEPVCLDRHRHLHVVRSCQEMLANAMKHSSARHIHVKLDSDETFCRLLVQDDGRGMSCELPEGTRSGGVGVRGLISRAQALNGQCDWHSQLGQGTTVTLRFPITLKPEPLIQQAWPAAASAGRPGVS